MAYPGQLNDLQPCPAPQRLCDAERTMILLDELVKMGEDLSAFASSRLSSITPVEPPTCDSPQKTAEQMTPLFSNYRDRIRQVNESIRRVRYTLERVEL